MKFVMDSCEKQLKQRKKAVHFLTYFFCRVFALNIAEVRKNEFNLFTDKHLLAKFSSIGLVKTIGFSTLLNYPNDFKFDVIIHDFSIGPCILSFVPKFNNPPLIGVSAFSNPSFTNFLVGGHQYYSYIPHNVLLTDDNMTFWQRIYNFILYFEENV